MRFSCKVRATVGAIPRANARREARAFLAATVDCRKTQHNILRKLLDLNADSRFSVEHHLNEVRTVKAFQKCLPVADYEYFRPYIDDMKLGDHQALLGSKNRLLMFCLSSGTTSKSKYIPITEQFLDDYRRGWQIWGIHTLDDHPRNNSGHIVQLSSDYERFRTPDGTPCGNISGLITAIQKRIVRTMYTVPGIVSKIDDPNARLYTALRLAVADDNATMLVTANPSTLIRMASLADSEKESLIRDISDGTLTNRYAVSQEVRDRLRRGISRKNPLRARQLEQFISQSGNLFPRDYWPDMQTIAVWSGGSAGAYLQTLRHYYGEAPIRDHGLAASEGRMTIPLKDNQSAGILDISAHFFEFIPEEEYETENPTILEAHELQADRNYYILLTTSSGLYRYNICDVVRCVGFYKTTPLLEFLHKGAHISNITGEKLSESQIVTAVLTCVERMDLRLKHFTVSPVWGDPPSYHLLIEERDVTSAAVGAGLAESVDTELQGINCEYRDKRTSGRLADMQWVPLPEGTWRKYTGHCQQRLGGSLEQYKHPCLVPNLEFTSQLLTKFAPESLNGRSFKAPANSVSSKPPLITTPSLSPNDRLEDRQPVAD